MERVWATRLRWRLRGAWQWPAFASFVIGDAVLLHLLPLAGDHGPPAAGALLLAGVLNLLAVALLAPGGGWLLRRRRPDLPSVIAADYAGTAAVVALAVVLAVAGIAHRPAARAQRDAYAAGFARLRAYLEHSAPREYRAHLAAARSMRFGDDLYRTCVPGRDPRRPLCVFIDTAQDPPGLRVDPNRAPNSTYLPAPGPGA